MRKLRTLLAVGVLLGLGAIAWAQTTPIRDWLGTEQFRITLGSGSSVPITLSGIRNTIGMSPVGAQTTATVAATANTGALLAVGAITTWNVTLPNPADKGQVFWLVNGVPSGTPSATVTTAAGTQSQSLAQAFAAVTITHGSPVGWIYELSSNTWFRLQ